MPTESPEEPSSPLSQYRRLVQTLLDQRKKIIDECQIDIKELESKRDRLLADNLKELLQMGVKEAEVPHAQLGTGRKFKKLDPSLVKEVLLGHMKRGEWYPSTPILEHLQISYPDFRDFVMSYPEFIERVGTNKGTRYKLRDTI